MNLVTASRSRTFLRRGLAAGLLCCGTWTATAAEAVVRYEVTVAPSLEQFAVRACFEGELPAELVAESDGAAFYLEWAKAGDRDLGVQSGRMVLRDAAEDRCIDYGVRLQPARGGAQSGGPQTRWIGGDLLTSIGDWLWRPQSSEQDLQLRFRLPQGISVSAPWQRIARSDGEDAFALGVTPYDWPGVVAFGHFVEQEIEIGGAVLRAAVLEGTTPKQRRWLLEGVERAAQQATLAHGEFPVPALQVLVVPASRGRSPVPWAYVSRGGGPAVHAFVVAERGPEAFLNDWSLLHEMSHLFLPYLDSRDAWLFEGLPTLFQNVLMARSTAISAGEAWRRMAAGFRRAARISPGISIPEATKRIGRHGNSLKVYWAGAAALLAVDLQLRHDSGGSQSLDSAVAILAQCCLAQDRRWSARELMERLDQESGTRVFSEFLLEQIATGDFPDFASLFIRAGVRVDGNQAELSADAPWAIERDALMRPR
ncbi:MAG: hypothetical protein ACKVP2_01230 [Burkholderiales bacterium]